MTTIINKTRHDQCPLCKSPTIRFISFLSYSNSPHIHTQSIKFTNTPELWKCLQCRSKFVQFVMSESYAHTYYRDGDSPERWTSSETFEQSKPSELIRVLKQTIPEKANVLDIGCNTGELLDFASSLGCQTYGIELSKKSKKILSLKNHKAYESLDEVYTEFDIITAFDLVEHIYDLKKLMDRCYDILKNNGKCIILTGNAYSLSSIFARSNWYYYKFPEHIVFPTSKFFEYCTKFRIDKYFRTYVNISYKSPIVTSIKHFIKFYKNYTGIPTIGPDHILWILKK